MSEHDDLIISTFVKDLLQLALKNNFQLDTIAEELNIDICVLENEDPRVNFKDYARIIHYLMVSLDDELIGLGGTQKSKVGTFRMALLTVVHCTTLQKSIQRLSEFYALFSPNYFNYDFNPYGNKAVIRLHHDLPGLTTEKDSNIRTFAAEAAVVIMHRCCSWLIDRGITLDKVSFPFDPPNHANEYKHLFNCPVGFNHDCVEISFDSHYLSLPVLQNEETLKDFMITSPHQLLRLPKDTTSLRGKIRSLVGKKVGAEFPCLEDIANQLNLTPQTLRRHLKRENTSYQDIKNGIKSDTAIYLLSRNELTINEIAEYLGFSETSAFHRAFKKWTGTTPGEYKQMKLSGQDGGG